MHDPTAHSPPPIPAPPSRRPRRWIAFAFLITAVAAVSVLVVQRMRAPPSLEQIKQDIAAKFPDVRVADPQAVADDLGVPGPSPLVVLDVRSQEEFAVSHLRNARRAENIDEALAILASEARESVIVCYCSVGWRSASLAHELTARGFPHVSNLDGSIFAWANAGRPLYRGSEPVTVVHPYDHRWGRLLAAERWAWKP